MNITKMINQTMEITLLVTTLVWMFSLINFLLVTDFSQSLPAPFEWNPVEQDLRAELLKSSTVAMYLIAPMTYLINRLTKGVSK
jgi:hypothetical protein